MCTIRCRRSSSRIAAIVSLAATAAYAEPGASPGERLRVEVTGSNIPRAEIETALPVQVLTREDIERSGSTTVAELMSRVSANIVAQTDATSIGSGVPGLSNINLRGIGTGDTLVLLNGRRVANYAFDGSAVDVNAIPLAAIERVEILKDGASAIYGADAVAGVVNFVLRRSFTGLELSGFGSWPQDRGGRQLQGTATAGIGDLAKDGYNAFATATRQQDDPLYAIDRPFSRTGYLPDAGLVRLPPTTFPSNIFYAPAVRLYNPSFATGCAPPYSLPATSARTPGDACGFDVTAYGMILPETERASVYGRGTLLVAGRHELYVELAWADTRLTTSVSPSPVAAFTNPGFEPVRYPAGGPFYPAEFAASNGITGDLDLISRTTTLGGRVNDVDTSAWRAVLGADGDFAGWDYGASLTYSRNDQADSLASGWVSLQRLQAAMATGLVNPFGASGPDGDALLAGAQITGETHTAQGTALDLLVKGSRDLVALPGGPLAVALGAEARRETLDNAFAPIVTEGDVVGLPIALQSASGDRNVQALFAEASVPLAKGFEAQVAMRYDHYSDFGGTTNPKLALRWQPNPKLLLRASWGQGFRAPPIYDLHTPQQQTFLLFFEDPLRCPVTGADTDCVVLPIGHRRKPGPAAGDFRAVQRRHRVRTGEWPVARPRLLEPAQVQPDRLALPGDGLRQLRRLCLDQHRARTRRSELPEPPGTDPQRGPDAAEPGRPQDLGHRRRHRVARPTDACRTLHLLAQRHLRRRVEDAATGSGAGLRVRRRPQRHRRSGSDPALAPLRVARLGIGFVERDARADVSIRLRGHERLRHGPAAATAPRVELRCLGRAGALRRLAEHDGRAGRQEPGQPRSAVQQPGLFPATRLRPDLRGAAWADLLCAADLRVPIGDCNGCGHRRPAPALLVDRASGVASDGRG